MLKEKRENATYTEEVLLKKRENGRKIYTEGVSKEKKEKKRKKEKGEDYLQGITEKSKCA